MLLIVSFALAACSGDDNETKASAGAPPATNAGDSGIRSTDSDASMPAPVQDPVPEQATAPEPEPEVTVPAVAAPEPEPEAEPESAVSTPSATPTQHIVKGVVTQWAPLVLFVEPGDQIVFRQMAGHDSETIEGMIPEGAETWKSKLGAEGFAVSPTVPGIYMYKCNPHVSLGMIGAIAVGDPPYANLDAIEAHPQNKGMIGRAIRKLKQALASREGA